jgi:hypothetical protein
MPLGRGLNGTAEAVPYKTIEGSEPLWPGLGADRASWSLR